MTDKLNFQIREYSGTEIFPYVAAHHPDHIHRELLTPIRQKDGLSEGDLVLVPALSSGYYLMTVRKNELGELWAEADYLMAALEFGKDERGAWICAGLINKRGLAKLKIDT